MSRQLPPLDLHAHISTTVRPADLERLGAVVFAATRSPDEYESVRDRRDQVTVWGLGCHPSVPEAQDAYDASRFEALLGSTAYVSEIGLDGRSKVPMENQARVLSSILASLQRSPRIVSIHSSGAPGRVLDVLECHRIDGAILHWWRGDKAQTRRAVQLGCWFSVNSEGMKHAADVVTIPLGRILTETDHPYGDRGSSPPRQPGAVDDVEAELARLYGLTAAAVRQQVWVNFGDLIDEVGVGGLLPWPVRRMLSAANNLKSDRY